MTRNISASIVKGFLYKAAYKICPKRFMDEKMQMLLIDVFTENS